MSPNTMPMAPSTSAAAVPPCGGASCGDGSGRLSGAAVVMAAKGARCRARGGEVFR